MYRCRYRNCCCQKNYNNNMIEEACSKCGTKADYYTSNNNMSYNDNDDTDDYDCKCGYDENNESVFPENPVLAQSYVPIQKLDKTFIPSVGLKMGTIFPELVSPYSPCQSLEDIAFIKAMNTVGKGCNKC